MSGFCFGKVQWLELPSHILYNKELVNHENMTINNKQMDEYVMNHPSLKLNDGAINYFPNELYKKTVRFAQELGPKKLISVRKWYL